MGGFTAVSSGRVLECARQLAAGGQPVTRDAVARLSGLKKAIVDDRLRVLVDAEHLRRTSRGVYALVEQYAPPRKMSKTILSDGYVEIVVGDEALLLTPEEDRNLAMLQAGAATAAVAAGVAQQQQQALGELVGQAAATQRDVRLFSRQLASAATMMKNEVSCMRRALARGGASEGAQLALCLRPRAEKRKDRKHGNEGEGNEAAGLPA